MNRVQVSKNISLCRCVVAAINHIAHICIYINVIVRVAFDFGQTSFL